jgi:hypothetical protein
MVTKNKKRPFLFEPRLSSIEMVEVFKCLGKKLTDQNSIQEEIKSRLKLGNVCYYSVQNLLSSRMLSKHS